MNLGLRFHRRFIFDFLMASRNVRTYVHTRTRTRTRVHVYVQNAYRPIHRSLFGSIERTARTTDVRSEFNPIRCVSLRLPVHGCTRVYSVLYWFATWNAYRFCSRSSVDTHTHTHTHTHTDWLAKRCPNTRIICHCYYRCNWHSDGNIYRTNGVFRVSLSAE